MKSTTLKRTLCTLALPTLFIALTGCNGNKPPESTPSDQQAKEKEAQDKLRSSYATDPTLQPPGGAKPAPGSLAPPGGNAPLAPGAGAAVAPPGAPPGR